jgi:hypothetical protein
MIPVPAGWQDAASGTHAPRWRATLLRRDGTVAVPDLPVVDGSIDKDDERRTQLSVNVPTQAVPGLIDQEYLPMGGRVRLDYSIGGTSWITVADCDMVASAIARPENLWTLAAVDQTYRIGLDDLSRGSVDFGTTTIGQAITNLIRRTLPGAVVDITGPATTLPIDRREDRETDGDPWKVIQSLATAASSWAWQDPSTRTFLVRESPSTPTEAGSPVDALTVGPTGSVTEYTINHEMAFNTVALVWESDADPPTRVIGTWVDTRPTSPVSLQRIGSHAVDAVVYRNVEAAQLPGQAQANATAQRYAMLTGGQMRKAELRHLSRPWLEPGDPVAVTFLGGPTETGRIRSVGITVGQDNIQTTRLATSEYKATEVVP